MRKLESWLITAYKVANENALKSHQRGKRYCDQKVRVLVRNVGLRGKQSLLRCGRNTPISLKNNQIQFLEYIEKTNTARQMLLPFQGIPIVHISNSEGDTNEDFPEESQNYVSSF